MADDIEEEIKNLPPAERIKKLKEIEEKRKKELKELEIKRTEDVKKAEEIIKASIEEITKNEEARFIRQETLRRELDEEREQLELEDTLDKEKPREQPLPTNIEYNPFDELQHGHVSIYNIANENVYGKLKSMTERLASGQWTEADSQLVEQVKEQIDNLQGKRDDDYFNEKDPNCYLKRTEEIIKNLDIYRRMKNL